VIIHSFEPIADEHCRVLILGSIPSETSLRKRQYYGHERNGFWRVVYALFGEEYDENYENRKRFLLRNNIALWDVIESCEREGSLDANIKNPVINDFQSFFKEHPGIAHVFFNGRKAYDLFKRHTKHAFQGVSFTYLTSTSPANAISFERKLGDWRKVPEVLNDIKGGKHGAV
jgi:hypoxanthine-DNA glycosylase